MVQISKVVSVILSFFTLIASLTGIIKNKPVYTEQPSVIQGFETKEECAIRIMSFNIRCTNVGSASWRDRIGIVSSTITDGHPDSVGVQEATPGWMTELNKKLGDEYAYVGVGRDDGDNLGEYSAIFYLKDKYNAVDSGTFWLSETPETPSMGWDAACKRVCTWVVLENKETGERYVHMNSHFDHVGVEARKNSVGMILEKAEEYSELPVVFTADMNVRQGSENYKQITSGCLKDSKFLAENSMDYLTYHDTQPSLHAGDVIDYVLINEHFDAQVYKVITEGVDGLYVSDHFPIYADLITK